MTPSKIKRSIKRSTYIYKAKQARTVNEGECLENEGKVIDSGRFHLILEQNANWKEIKRGRMSFTLERVQLRTVKKKSCPAKGNIETQLLHLYNPSFSLSASRDVFGFVASLEARVGRVEALLVGSEQSPAGSLGCVIQGWEALPSSTLLVSLDQLLETLVVDPCPPLAVHLELKSRERETKW